jgi:hypothetical protein
MAILLCVQHAAARQSVTLDELLGRATVYVEDFLAKFSAIVAEEQYVQEYLTATAEGSRGTFRGSPQVRDRRTLTSDFLLVRPLESREWYVFRDTFDVDGRPVRDRQERLTKLFLESKDTPTALERASQIATASARFNIRPIGTVDHPLLGLGFLQRSLRQRFRFNLRGRDASAGRDAWIVEFRETARPTIIRGSGDKDIFASGRYWIDGTAGTILQTQLSFTSLGTESSVTTVFERDAGLHVDVPVEMRFRRAAATNEVRGVATYGRFRQFEVRTEEAIRK